MTTQPLDLSVNNASDTNETNERYGVIGNRIRNLDDQGVLAVEGLTLPAGAANLVLATPDGVTLTKGVTALRALIAADLPSIPDSKLSANVALLNRNGQTFSGDPQVINGKLGVGGTPSYKLHVTAQPSSGTDFVARVDNGGSTSQNPAVSVAFTGAGGQVINLLAGTGGAGLQVGNTSLLFFTNSNGDVTTPTNERMRIAANGNVGIGGASFGGGVGVVFLGTATTAPTSNPTGGFILYIDPADTKLKVRGPSGTITTLANP